MSTVLSVASSISRTTSATAFQRKERGPSKTKRLPDDGFVSVYNANCDAAGLKSYPAVVITAAEISSWLGTTYDRKNVAPKTSAMRSVQSATESRTPLEIKRSQHAMKTPSKTKEPQADREICAVYNDPEKEGCINMLIYKHFPMEDAIMGALQKTLIKFTTLKTLRLEFCNLSQDQLKAVKFILMKCDNIVELSIDGNPLSYQNYYILLKDTKLISLSLKFCKIDDIGVNRLASHLCYPLSRTLVVLDLSSNFIGDDGCEGLANALRTNRTLTHLSLASNNITIVGCRKLMEVLKRFTLRHKEVLLKRKLNMDYLLKYRLAQQSAPMFCAQDRTSLDSIKPQRTSSKIEKKRASIIKNKKDKPSSSSGGSLKHLKRSRSITSSTSPTNMIVEKDPHPYMHECVHEDKKVYCRGNSNLEYLNLSYNSIDCVTESGIKAVLVYQLSLKSVAGIMERVVKLILDGNPLVDSTEYKIMTELTSESSLPQTQSTRRSVRRSSIQTR
ncbi:hypothetical protein Trydic_g10848 [Trypoxylus dichotomus]